VQDPAEKNQPGIGLGRDPERSPMIWDESSMAGFTEHAEAWLPLVEEHAKLNVSAQSRDPSSLLKLYRELLTLRRNSPALLRGSIDRVFGVDGVLSYMRRDSENVYWIYLNLTSEFRTISSEPGTFILSSNLDKSDYLIGGPMALRPNEAIVVRGE
jgi:alpha-glucosidase